AARPAPRRERSAPRGSARSPWGILCGDERASQPTRRGGPVRAVVLERLAGPDGMALAERPEPSAEGVLLDVYAAGVSFPDLLLSQGRYQLRPEVPFVMG